MLNAPTRTSPGKDRSTDLNNFRREFEDLIMTRQERSSSEGSQSDDPLSLVASDSDEELDNPFDESKNVTKLIDSIHKSSKEEEGNVNHMVFPVTDIPLPDLTKVDEDDQTACSKWVLATKNPREQELLNLPRVFVNSDDEENGSTDNNDPEASSPDDEEIEFEEYKNSRMWNDINGDGGILKNILREGIGGLVLPPCYVFVHYEAYLKDSKSTEPFDSTKKRNKPSCYRIDRGEMIPGLEIGIKSMRLNEKAEFIIAPKYAWGYEGAPPRILPNSTVYFVVELMKIMDDVHEMALRELRESGRRALPYNSIKPIVLKDCQRGRADFQRGNYRRAIHIFSRAEEYAVMCRVKNDAEDEKRNKSLVRIYYNLALCYYKMGNSVMTSKHCKRCIDFDPLNGKAYLLYGDAQRALKSFHDARKMYIKARNCGIDSELVQSLLGQLAIEQEESRRKTMELSQNMRKLFGGPPKHSPPRFSPSLVVSSTAQSPSSESSSEPSGIRNSTSPTSSTPAPGLTSLTLTPQEPNASEFELSRTVPSSVVGISRLVPEEATVGRNSPAPSTVSSVSDYGEDLDPFTRFTLRFRRRLTRFMSQNVEFEMPFVCVSKSEVDHVLGIANELLLKYKIIEDDVSDSKQLFLTKTSSSIGKFEEWINN
ncbi:unnamed protein product [Cyprideis torosa]|uniref:peptidylprolyl isomerase n=1 Tax=Cyprideis torosa TaxID=163714 RepID=A0A7R8WEM0_9CRUS|nr:unnamed protein product [Cyprideis torosa]CAG0895792.1 unnamed protein product [Cyprideis torosa]